MLAVIRLRGGIKVNREINDTLKMLKLDKINTMRIIKENPSFLGMIKKVENFVTWGEISQELLDKFGNKKVINLKSPRGGLKSIKKNYPKGDLGYRGTAINDLIKRMM
ncbi:MAG: uL30 family ribosomal protein [Candidatus Aenigmatarchaeota archaeon]